MNRFVCWLWRSANRDFNTGHVNVLRSMLERHCDLEKLICITDDTQGLDSRIEAFPMPHTGLEHVPNPAQVAHPHKKFPTCYRRLWVFSDEAKVLGDRIVCIDIDVVVIRDCQSLFEREGSFVGWSDEKFGWNKIAGGMFMLDTGSHTDVWGSFDPDLSPAAASANGCKGSDQGHIANLLYPLDDYWSREDGLVKINWTPKHKKELPDARIVFTNGHQPPWHSRTKIDYPWVKEHWL